VQYYLCNEMHDSGHGQGKCCSRAAVVREFGIVQEKLAQRGKTVRLIEVGPSQGSYKDEYLTVRYNVPAEIMERYHWIAIQQKALAAGRSKRGEDAQRRNLKVDLGFTGHRNSERLEDTYGLSHPRKFLETMEPWSIMIFLAQTFLILTEFAYGDIYQNADRAAYFASLIHPQNIVEAMRAAITDKYHLLLFHWDIWNDSKDPRYAYVLVICCYLYHPDDATVVQRVACISYGKQAAYDFMANLGNLGVPLKAMKKFWNDMTDKEKFVTHDMLLPKGPAGTPPKRMGYTHVSKNIFYICFVYSILRMSEVYKKVAHSLEMLCALIVCGIASECPDHYWHGIQAILQDPAFLGEDYRVEKVTGKEFGWRFWCYLHDRKEEHDYNKKKEKAERTRKKKHDVDMGELEPPFLETKGPPWKYTTQQRHQPCVTRGQQADFNASVDVFMEAVVQMNLVDAKELSVNVGHYFTTIVGIFCNRNRRGVFGAGPLTGQHLVVIAAFLGLFPSQFVDFAEIAIGTGSHTSLMKEYGFPADPVQAVETNRKFLAAVASLLDISFCAAEEAICKLTSLGRYGDSIFPGAPYPYLCPRSNDIRLLWHEGKITKAPNLLVNMMDLHVEKKNDDWWKQKLDTKRIPKKASTAGGGLKPTNFWDYFPQEGLERSVNGPGDAFTSDAISNHLIHPGKMNWLILNDVWMI